jgi:hypothetical protein
MIFCIVQKWYNFTNIYSEATKFITVRYFKKHTKLHTINMYYPKKTVFWDGMSHTGIVTVRRTLLPPT